MDNDDYEFPNHSGIDRLIHEPARFELMAHLYVVSEADMVFLQRQTKLTWGNISAHLTKLEKAGYLTSTKAFVDRKPRTVVALTKTGKEAFMSYREAIRRKIEQLPDAKVGPLI